MLELGNYLSKLREEICKGFHFEITNKRLIKIYTPFSYDDGDIITIGLELNKNGKEWRLTDGSDTFLHLRFHFDDFNFYQGKRKELILDFLKNYSTEEIDGELIKSIDSNNLPNSIYEFIQCILKVSNLTILDREIVETTFQNDLRYTLNTYLNNRGYQPKLNYKFDYFVERDEEKIYKIDCYIETKKAPLFAFAIGSRYTCQNATISILMLEKMNLDFHPIAFFKNQIDIPRKVAVQLSDVAEKTISNLDQFDRFEKYFEKLPYILQ